MVDDKKIPDGYKKTEVRVIPEDWDCLRMGNVVNTIQSGKSKTKINDNGIYSIYGSTGRIGSCAKTDYEGQKILVARVGANAGSLYCVNGKYCVTDNTLIIEVGEKVRFDFVYSYLKYFNLNKLVFGSGQPLITGTQLKNLKIPVPTRPEQQAIAEALSDVDNLITSFEKLIDKKQKIKQGTMQELLTGKRRLPGFTEEWKVKKIRDFGDIVTGGTPSTIVKEFWNGTIPWVTPTDISNKKEIYNTEREITELGLKRLRKLSANSVLITCIASIGKNAILKRTGACNQQINAIIPNCNYNSDFLYYLFEANKHYLLNNAGITATNIISKKDFSELEFNVPDIEEQQAIAQILSDMDSEIEALQKKLEKYKAIKQGMMEELLTGRIRLV